MIVGPDLPEYDHLGYAVTRVGDLNGDGREDIAVMANTGDTSGRTNNGIVWVVPGQTGVASVDVSNPGAVLARIDGASPGSGVAPFGQMIGLDGVGDVNGDGTPDIGIGTYTATAFGRTTASGAAFAISGTTRGQVDLGVVVVLSVRGRGGLRRPPARYRDRRGRGRQRRRAGRSGSRCGQHRRRELGRRLGGVRLLRARGRHAARQRRARARTATELDPRRDR